MGFLMDPEKEEGKSVKRKLIHRLGDEEMVFEASGDPGSPTISIVNSSSSQTVTATFANNPAQGTVSTTYVTVGPNQTQEVTSYFNQYLDGGNIGINIIPTLGTNTMDAASVNLDGVVIATTAGVSFSIGSTLTVNFQPDQVEISNSGTAAQDVSIEISMPSLGDTDFNITGTVPGVNGSITLSYPEGVDVNVPADICLNSFNSNINALRYLKAQGRGSVAPIAATALQPVYVVSHCCNTMVLDSNTTGLVINDKASSDQMWLFTPQFNPTGIGGPPAIGFTISPVNNPGVCIQFTDESEQPQLAAYDPSNAFDFLWEFAVSTSTGAFYIMQMSDIENDNTVLNVHTATCENGNPVWAHEMQTEDSERWTFATS